MKSLFVKFASHVIGNKLRHIGVSCLMAGLWPMASAQAEDLSVWFAEEEGGVRISILTWVVPEAVTVVSSAVSLDPFVGYQVATEGAAPLADGIRIRNVSGEETVFNYAVLLSEAGNVAFTNLNTPISYSATANENLGGIRMSYGGTETLDTLVLVFDTYDAATRLATFDIELWLNGATFNDLFTSGNVFDGGAFDVWTSDSFDIQFAAVPEPTAAGLLLGGGMLALLLARRSCKKADLV